MGRIADALKRAEEERCRNLGVSPPNPDVHKLSAVFHPVNAALETASRAERREVEELDKESLCVVEGLSESLVPFFERSSLVTEQYRSLRTRLLSQNPNYEHRIIAITSAVPKEGKSVTTLNLGCILAEIRHLKVLVTDGDFRRSSLAHMLNRPANPGLAEVISGEATYEEALHSTPIPNLKLIPAGNSKGRSAAELLTATGALPAFRRMQNDFHYTIVDTPPATTVTDVGIIGQMCTGVIVVIRLHQTHEGVARRAVRLLQANNIPIIGCLLVGRDAPGTHYGYGYGYGYRHNYYRYYDNTRQDQEEV